MADESNAPNIRNSRKPPADYTGKQKERLQAQHEVEVAEAADQMALATAQKAASDNRIVDYTGADTPLDEVETAKEVETNEPFMTVRILADIEQMTFGRQVYSEARTEDNGVYHPAVLGPLNFFDFEAGRRYKVPRDLGLHLIKLEYADRL